MKLIVNKEPMMEYTVRHTVAGFILEVRVIGKTVNEWNMGLNEEIAQSRVSTIITSYMNGLEFIQEEIRTKFDEATKE